jgi:hypothetical protein
MTPPDNIIPLHRGIRMADARPREASDASSPERPAPFRQWLDPESLRAVNDEHPTQRDEEVTCPRCLSALGYEATADEQLTVCAGDPLRRAA